MIRRISMHAALTAGVVGSMVAVPYRLTAQCSGQASCTVTINLPATTTVARLTLNTSTTNLGSPAAADFAAGGLAADGPTVTVKANHAYTVSVIGSSPTFSFTGSPNPNKPRSDLTWGAGSGAAPGSCPLSPTSLYSHDMGTSATLITAGTGAPAIGSTAPSQKICYRTLWNAGSAPAGVYSLIVNFTLSEP